MLFFGYYFIRSWDIHFLALKYIADIRSSYLETIFIFFSWLFLYFILVLGFYMEIDRFFPISVNFRNKLPWIQCYHIFSNSMVVYLAKNHYEALPPQVVPKNPLAHGLYILFIIGHINLILGSILRFSYA